MDEPAWPNVHYPKIDFQAISYYAAPKQKPKLKSMDEVDPELLRTFEKLGVPLHERMALAGVAVDVIFDSVSVATTYKDKLAEVGIIFCSMSEAVLDHPELVKKYLGTVIPTSDNFYAALNSAVFTDGSFCYIPKGVKCPMDLSTYFRINTEESGQFERTLIVAEEGRQFLTLKAVPRLRLAATSYMRPLWSSWHLIMLTSSIQQCKIGMRVMRKASVEFTTS